MPDYRRAWRPGGTWFFTINLLQRNGNDLLIRHIDLLRTTVYKVRSKHPFAIHGWVVLPDHMYCIISPPENDTDFVLRWRLIKSGFSKQIPPTEYRSPVRSQRGETGIWQRRYWEHLIRDEADYAAHMDYIHINPIKHGVVGQVADWSYSTFHRYVEQRIAPDTSGAIRCAIAPYEIWRLIKSGFSKQIPPAEYRSPVRSQRGERGIWQRRYWEHLIRDEADYAAHMDYIHINPIKHGLVGQVVDWPYSTFHRYVEQGVYPRDWAGNTLSDGLGYVD